MTKNFTYALMLLLLMACGNDDKNSLLENRIYYQYGSDPLPGSLPVLSSQYRARNLSSKVINVNGEDHSPMNILSQNLNLEFDISTAKVQATSRIRFTLPVESHPYFELLAPAVTIKRAGIDVATSKISDPDNLGNSYWSVNEKLAAGVVHEVEVSFQLPSEKVTFTAGGVRILSSMNDLNTAKFFEQFGPSTFEDDQFELTLNFKVIGASSTHRMFSNGSVTTISDQEWQVTFPAWFNKSSFYFHLTNNPSLHVSQFNVPGEKENIPVLVYSSNPDLVSIAVELLPGLFREMEKDYGPYPHNSFTAYINPSGGGMEYAGATVTSIPALDHELFHSWFARSVMPAEGRSGWLDEALASWRDYGYFQAPSLLQRSPTMLSAYSPYRKSTPSNSYRDGRELIAELDRVLASFGGMKFLMRLLAERYQHQIVTNEEFWSFLSDLSGIDLEAFNRRYTQGSLTSIIPAAAKITGQQNGSQHPLPLTSSEIEKLR